MKTREGGFTLIEVMVALFILTVGFLGTMSMQLTGMKGNHFGLTTTQATNIAEMKMEEIEKTAYSALATVPCSAASQTDKRGSTNYSWNCTVTKGPSGTTWSMVEIQVNWPGKFGGTRVLNAATIIDG